MRSVQYWSYRTPEGLWSIRPLNGRWHALFNEKSLGVYDTAEQAVLELAGGHAFWTAAGDEADYSLPDDLDDWIAH